MHHGIFTYAWDLQDHGYDAAIGEIANAGFSTINLATQYHAGKFLLPRNPKRRVYFQEDGAIFFKPDLSRYGAMKPRVHSLVTDDTNPVHQTIVAGANHGLTYTAWTVCLHNSWLGEQFPEATQHTPFGDSLRHSLSPAHPLSREYLIALLTDLVNQQEVAAIQLESPGYMGFYHGDHHEIIGTELDPVQQLLMGLSFSDLEVERATADGLPAGMLRGMVAALLDASLNQGVRLANRDGEPSTVMRQLLSPGALPAYISWLKQQEISLCAEIREAVHEISPETKIWHFAGLDGSDEDRALMATSDGILAGYAQSEEDVFAKVDAANGYRAPVRGAIRAIAPDTISPNQIQPRFDAWAGAGVEGIDVYNFGLMNGVIWNEVKRVFRSSQH